MLLITRIGVALNMNCVVGAIIIKMKLKQKSEIKWRKPKSLFCDPWGHFYVVCKNKMISYSSKNKDLHILNQLWFNDGFVKMKNYKNKKGT